MSKKIAILSCVDYSQEKVDATISKSLEIFGGISSIVSPEQNVLLKPNLLSASSPEYAITTHPSVVESIAKLVKEAGGNPIIADSSGNTTPYNEKGLKKIYESTGMTDVAENTGASLNFDTEVVQVSNPDGLIVKRLEVIKPVVDADVIINIPKLKTHTFTTFTGAVKNLFGVIPGYTKAAYHAKFQNLERFTKMLVDILGFVKPELTVMDGIVGIEGDGPGKHGSPRQIGVIITGKDSVLVDAVACRIVGIKLNNVSVITEAIERGWWSGEFEEIELIGNLIEDVSIPDFQMPSTSLEPNFIKQKWLVPIVSFILKSALTRRPVPRKSDCIACGACVKACPQNAISIVKKLAVVDDSKCIRCYCCHELCPEGAIDLNLSWFGHLIKKSGIAGKKDNPH